MVSTDMLPADRATAQLAGERPVSVVVFGVGAMGSILTRLLLEKGATITGAIARSPAKIGRDLGDVARLDRPVGVIVRNDPARVLAEARADIAVVSVSSYLRSMAGHFRLCLEAGTNVVTIEEESFYPWLTAPELAAELDTVAKRHGVTIVGSGAQDAFWMTLPSVLMGAAQRVDSVFGRTCWNVDDYGPEVAEHQFAGRTVAEFNAHVAEHSWPSFVVRNTVDALVADAGLTPGRVEASARPVVAEADTPSRSLGRVIAAGRLLGIADTATITTIEGPRISFEMTGYVYGPNQADRNEWFVRGEPAELHLCNERVPTRLATCTQVVNRIPDVIGAPAGFLTVTQLPRLRYRHFPLRRDVTR
jgi:2,4-diaminopentanoate dehydrogenase